MKRIAGKVFVSDAPEGSFRSAAFFPARGGLVAPCTSHNGRIFLVFLDQFAPAVKARGIQVTGRYGALYGTARFMCVSAVAEFASGGQLGDFSEQDVQTGLQRY